MNEQHENVQPETIDQVIEGGKLSLHDRQTTRLIEHLHGCSQEYAQENERSLDRIWSRLTQRQEHPVFLQTQRKRPEEQPIPLSRKERTVMQDDPRFGVRNRPPSSRLKQLHSLGHVVSVSLLVAVALITIVSFTIFSNVLRPAALTTGKGTMTGAPRQQQQLQQQKTISNGSLVCSVGIDNPPNGVFPGGVLVDWSTQGEIAAASPSNVTMFSARDCSAKTSKPLSKSYPGKWSPDGNKLFIVSNNKTLNILDKNGSSLATIPSAQLGSSYLNGMTWSSDSTKLIFVSQDSNHQESIKSIDAPTASNEKTLMTAPSGSVVILLSADGKFALLLKTCKSFSVWDVNSGKKVSDDISPQGLAGMAFSPDSSLLALDSGRQVQVYATATGKLVTSFDSTKDTLRPPPISLAWSPDGTYIARGQDAITIYDVKAGKKVATFGQVDGEHKVKALAWAPDSTGLVSSTTPIKPNDHSQAPVNVWKLN